MDACAVSIGISLTLTKMTRRHIFRLAWHFGLFQGLMTAAGWFLGKGISSYISSFGGILAGAILCFLGLRMIKQSMSPESVIKPVDPTRGLSLIALSIATSIDAFAVGVSIALLDLEVLIPALVIGIVALVCSLIGVFIGKISGLIAGAWAERLGGVILIFIGIMFILNSS